MRAYLTTTTARALVFSLSIALTCLWPPAAFAQPIRPSASGSAGAHRLLSFDRITITIGRRGGNIPPFTATITSDGSVLTNGAIHTAIPLVTLSRDTFAGLLTLATAENFATLPGLTTCDAALADLATLFISIRTPQGHKTAAAHGNCQPGFNQLYAVILATLAPQP